MSRGDAGIAILSKADALGRFLENLLLSALLAGMIGLGASQIAMRWLGIAGLAWGDEAIRMMVLWIAMVAGIAAAREDRHIAIDVLSRFLQPRIKTIATILVDFFTALVCLALAWYGWKMVEFAIEDSETLLAGLPAWFFQGIIPVAFLLMAYRYLLWCLKRLRQLQKGEQA